MIDLKEFVKICEDYKIELKQFNEDCNSIANYVVLNESLQEKNLIEFVNQYKDDKQSFNNIFGNIFRMSAIAWDKIDSSRVTEYEGGNAQGKKSARKIIKGEINGFILIKSNSGKFTNYLDENSLYAKRNYYGERITPNQKICLSLLDDCKSFYIYDLTGLSVYDKRRKREEDREGMIDSHDPEQLQKIARQNIERYKAIVAKNKVDKENHVDEYDDIVKSLIDEFSNIMYKISKNPGKYADIWTSVSSIVYSVNSTSSWNKGRKVGSDGLLTVYSHYVVSKLRLSKGDSNYVDLTKSEFENAKKDLDKAIESMERTLKSIKDKL